MKRMDGSGMSNFENIKPKTGQNPVYKFFAYT